jgi:VIT1/CCC1 family predicted Fe2+/Mn2+ transporter
VWLWAALIGHSAFCILHSPFPPVWLWGRIGGRIGGALGSHWGGSGVALGWPWGAYQLATNRLWGGSDVALMSHCGGFGSPSAFFILPSAFAPAWLWALPAFLLSTFCFLLLQGGGIPLRGPG